MIWTDGKTDRQANKQTKRTEGRTYNDVNPSQAVIRGFGTCSNSERTSRDNVTLFYMNRMMSSRSQIQLIRNHSNGVISTFFISLLLNNGGNLFPTINSQHLKKVTDFDVLYYQSHLFQVHIWKALQVVPF